MKKIGIIILAILLLVGFLSGCVEENKKTEPEDENKDNNGDKPNIPIENNMTISSPAFANGSAIPSRYTCDGLNINPKIVFTNVPTDAINLVLIMEDPDVEGEPWVHWIVYNIPGNCIGFDEGEEIIHARGNNSWNEMNYSGPCPPDGETHHYYFKLYGLDAKLDLQLGISKNELLEAMGGHIVAESILIGTYGS